jgi:hypothetical protein
MRLNRAKMKNQIQSEDSETIRLRPHHVTSFAEYHINHTFEYPLEAEKRYGKDFIRDVRRIWERISSRHSDIQIKIVDGYDTLCDICKLSEEGCDAGEDDDSLRFVAEAGLKVGQSYAKRDFLARIRESYRKAREDQE